MTIKEIDSEIQRLTNLRYKLDLAEIENFKKEAQKNVGRCFKVNGQYAKIIGVPTEEYTKTGEIVFNRYQYPAIYLGHLKVTSIIPFYEDTLFSAAWGVGHNVLNVEFEEISPEEFKTELDKRIEKFQRVLT